MKPIIATIIALMCSFVVFSQQKYWSEKTGQLEYMRWDEITKQYEICPPFKHPDYQYKLWNDSTKQWDEYPTFSDYVFEKSEFIFEGTVIKNEGYWSEKDQMIYTSNIVQIDKIFRGQNTIKSGTIEIVTRGGRVDDRWYEFPNERAYTIGSKGVFFCITSNYAVSNLDAYNKIRIKTLTLAGFAFDGIRIFNKNYKNKDELYNFLSKQKNITIPKEELLLDKKKDVDGSGVKTKENQTKYAERVKNVQQYEQYLQQKIAKQSTKANDACKEFFISEYIDGPNAPNKNKVLEIYNPSDSVKSLNGYSIKIFNNGAPTPLDIPLYGNVNPKETRVITHPNAHPDILAKADQTDVNMNFDGNDAIVLNKGQSTYIDKIGEIGVNPGQGGWSVPLGGSTKQHDLRRKQPIDKGETDWNQGKNQWEVHPKDSIQNIKQHQNICSAAAIEDVYYTFANPIESGTNPKYFEFDIMVEGSSSNTYLDNAAFFIQYNTTAFGSNVVANNKITITAGTNFNSVTYVNPNTTVQDDAADVFNFYIGSDFNAGAWNRTNVTPTPQQLVHIKIEIANCNQNTSLQVINQTQTSNVSFYTDNATEDFFGTLFSYGNTNYTNNMYERLCELKITNFTSPVYPGTYYDGTAETKHILTIQGSGFGATRGNGNVYFKNADTGGQNNTFLNGSDIKSWTDNEIIITVPSTVDTSIFAVDETRIPGSGTFFIVTNTGDSVFSTTPIDMPYAIKNAIDPLSTNGKLRMDLVNKTDTVGYEFYLGPSITNHSNPMVETIVRRAVFDWACNTLANFVVKGDTTVDSSLPDGVSVIHLVSSFPNTTTLAETTIGAGSCGESGNPLIKHIFPTEIDIAILADPATISQGTWLYDTSSAVLPAGFRDFYEVAIHEVGHGNLLSHVNNVNDVMFYTGLYDVNNNIIGGNRRWLAFNDVVGGENVVERSKTIVYSGSCSFEASSYISGGFSCAGVIYVKGHPIILTDINLFPNPANNGFTVDYELKRNASVQFTFLDYTGRELKRFDLQRETAGQHNLFVETGNLTAGLYFLVATIDGKMQTMKVIKH